MTTSAKDGFGLLGEGLTRQEAPRTWDDDGGMRHMVPLKARLDWKKGVAKVLREHVLRRDGGRCVRCGGEGSVGAPLVMHHVVDARFNGGSHHPANLRTLCRPCNASLVGTVQYAVPGMREYDEHPDVVHGATPSRVRI